MTPLQACDVGGYPYHDIKTSNMVMRFWDVQGVFVEWDGDFGQKSVDNSKLQKTQILSPTSVVIITEQIMIPLQACDVGGYPYHDIKTSNMVMRYLDAAKKNKSARKNANLICSRKYATCYSIYWSTIYSSAAYKTNKFERLEDKSVRDYISGDGSTKRAVPISEFSPSTNTGVRIVAQQS
uniref:Protein kinase domain-containing protein n=1 Tax=Rhabditophanes sp. KR3021 TaxID=114890 RepID=A0AC35U9P5_9BILA